MPGNVPTAPFGFCRLTHARALELRAPGVPPSPCDGAIVFRRLACPGDPYSPSLYRCAACGDLLCLRPGDGLVLWAERAQAGGPAADAAPWMLDLLRSYLTPIGPAPGAAARAEFFRLYTDTLAAIAVAEGRAVPLEAGR